MIKQTIKKLSEPIPYKWRVQSANRDRTKVQLTAYIDARQVMDVLDEHCDHGWSSEFHEIAGGIFCTITIHDGNHCYSRTDAGNRIEDNNTDQMYEQGFKSSASDAFKRAAVQFGVGRFLYDIDTVWLPCNDKRQPVRADGSVIWDLTEYMNKEYKKSPEPKKKPVEKKPVEKTVAQEPEGKTEVEEPKKKLDQKTLDEMVKAISAGKGDVVRERMPNYDMTLQQKTILNALLK